MLKFENIANVGDKIRAYDFYGNTEAYIEGEVVEKGWMPNGALGYTINIEKDSVQEHFEREGDVGYVAYEIAFLEYDNRIEVLERAA